MVTQLDVARGAGVDVSTVNRILHRKSGPRFREQTVSKVLRTAQKLRYPMAALKHPHRRSGGRQEVALHCELTIYDEGGIVFDRGRAVVSDLSPGGARIENLRLPKHALPLRRSVIGIRLLGLDFEIQGEIVRFHPGKDFSLGLALYPLARPAQALLLRFVEGRKSP